MLVQTQSTKIRSGKSSCAACAKTPGFSTSSAPTSTPITKLGFCVISQYTSAGNTEPDIGSEDDFTNGIEDEYHGTGGQREPETNAHIAANVSQQHHIDYSHRKTPRVLHTIKRSNKLLEALFLPTIVNLNPRSIYNKVDEFHAFVESENVDIIFMSEPWEREKKTLSDIIKLEGYEVISNVYQRKEPGGRPALIVKKDKFHIKNLTNTLIHVKWGVEVVWTLLTPKNVSQSSKIQHIACTAIYCKPGSRHKSDLLDHISDAFNIVNTKYGKGLHMILAGDTNELRLRPILDLSPNFVQIVTKPTRTDKTTGKHSILDPIIMTLAQYYREPDILAPLDYDPGKIGKPSDHNIVMAQPISAINNQTARVTRKIQVQPFTDSGLKKMKDWLMSEEWETVHSAETANQKAEIFQETITNKYNDFFPKKYLKLSNEDQPWIKQKFKKLDRQRKRLFHKNRRSDKWKIINKEFKHGVKKAKKYFYKKMVED